MDKVGVIFSQDFLLHSTGASHPETSERISRVYGYLKQSDLNPQLDWILAESAELEDVYLNHDPEYVRYLEETCKKGEALLDDGDTRVSKDSYRVALLGAGAAIEAVSLVTKGPYRRTFAAVRPPGHHATSSHAMGFCLLNNVAIAAKAAIKNGWVKKVAIIDFDVHHGNGTQDSFYEDDQVLFISLHESPLFPGTGSPLERGIGRGEGYNINIQLTAGSDIETYRDAFSNVIIPSVIAYEPDLIMISAGFDAHRLDPLANIELTEQDFYELTSGIVRVAQKVCDGRVVSLLEGGYHLDALAKSVYSHLLAMRGVDDSAPQETPA